MLSRSLAIARRVFAQLIRDHRFVAISMVVPVVVIYVFKVFFDAAATPLLRASIFVVPYGAFFVHFITYVLAAIVLVRERTANTLERMFIAGFRRSEIILGYVGAYSTLATLQSLVVLVGLQLLFELDYNLPQFASLYLVMWLLAVISMALGVLVSNFARNEGQVFPFIPLIMLPTIFFSGIIIAVEKLPEWAQRLSFLTPLYYANQVIQQLIEGQSLADAAPDLAGLAGYGLAILLLANITLRECD